MNEIKAVIFDLDGTLLDSMYVWAYVDEEFLRKRNFSVPEDYGRQCSHRSFYETAVYTIELFGLQSTPEEIMAEWTSLAKHEYSVNVSLKSLAAETVLLAKSKGYKTAVCTSLNKELYLPALERNGIASLFDVIVSAAEFGTGKQYPDIYLHTAQLLSEKPHNCVMIDDVSASLKGAKEAGLITIGVNEPMSCQDKAQMQLYSDKLIDSFDENVFVF